MDDYLAKPLRFEALAQVCERRLSEGPPPPGPDAAADPAPPAFDASALDGVAAGVRARELLALFVDQLQDSARELSELAAAGDVRGVHRAAHRLKGGAAVVGARRVADACQDICSRTRADHDPGLAQRPAALDAAARECVRAITAHLQGQPAAV
jgi:HPt (histidine-containing phosphotransfer) domain-containing protein